MKVKILGNVKHNGISLVEGDVVEMSKAEAEALIEGGIAETTTAKATKKAPKPEHGVMELHITSKDKSKVSKKKE